MYSLHPWFAAFDDADDVVDDELPCSIGTLDGDTPNISISYGQLEGGDERA